MLYPFIWLCDQVCPLQSRPRLRSHKKQFSLDSITKSFHQNTECIHRVFVARIPRICFEQIFFSFYFFLLCATRKLVLATCAAICSININLVFQCTQREDYIKHNSCEQCNKSKKRCSEKSYYHLDFCKTQMTECFCLFYAQLIASDFIIYIFIILRRGPLTPTSSALQVL